MKYVLIALALAATSIAEGEAQVPLAPGLDPAEVAKLEGNSGITSQWVATDVRGRLRVSRTTDGLLQISGRQKSADGKGVLIVEGRILSMTPGLFTFEGLIEIDDGDDNPPEGFEKVFPCRRDGLFTFRVTGKRQYWRMKEQQGYCGDLTDYVDIFF